MAKASGGTKTSSWRDGEIQFKGSDKGKLEITDEIDSYNLPIGIKMDRIKSIKTYDDLSAFLKNYGIELSTDLDSLKEQFHGTEIEAVKEMAQKIALGVETYNFTFGSDSLRSLKKVVLYSDNEDSTAAYYYNKIGENDTMAGTIRFRNFNAKGRVVFHELAHAFQDSNKKKGEDAVMSASRMIRVAKLDEGAKAYFGAKASDIDAERMADALGSGFTIGRKKDVEFIKRLRKSVRRK